MIARFANESLINAARRSSEKIMYSAPLTCPHCGSEDVYTFLGIRLNQTFACKACKRAIVMTQDMMDRLAPPPSAETITDTGPDTPTPGIKR